MCTSVTAFAAQSTAAEKMKALAEAGVRVVKSPADIGQAADVPWVILCQPNFNLPVREQVAGWVQPMDGLARLRYLSASA